MGLPLLERERELDVLGEVLESARAGGGAAVLRRPIPTGSLVSFSAG